MKIPSRAAALVAGAALLLVPSLPSAAASPDSEAAETSVQEAADWIVEQWDPEGSNSPGGIADSVIALAAADTHPGVIDEMTAAMAENAAQLAERSGSSAAKFAIALDAAGEDPRTFLEIDLIETIDGFVEDEHSSVVNYLGPTLVLVAEVRAGEGASEFVLDALEATQAEDGGFGYIAGGEITVDPDYTAQAISALQAVSDDPNTADELRTRAAESLDAGIAWAEDPANQYTDGEGRHYWATYSSANTTGLMASALYEAGRDVDSPVDYLISQQELTGVGAWSTSHDGTSPNLMATTQAILGVAGENYATVQFDSDEVTYSFTDADVRECVDADNVFVIVDPQDDEVLGGCATEFATGDDAIQSAGFTIDDPSFVTEINGIRADYENDGEMWAYFHRAFDDENGQWADWEYSQVGLSEYEPEPGSIEGWSISPADAPDGVEPRWDGYEVEPVVVTAASAGIRLVGQETNLWGTANVPDGTQIHAQHLTNGTWETITTGEVTNGRYTLPLNTINTRGEHQLRALTGDTTSETVTLTRINPTTLAHATTKPAGQATNVWGTVDGTATISTQVQIGNRWVTSQTRQVQGGYNLPLTYGTNQPGRHTYRLQIQHTNGPTEYSTPWTLTRTPVITAASATTKPVGQATYVWGTTTPNTRVWTEVQTSQGWTRSQQTTTNTNGGYTMELTYARNTPGTTTWRVTTTNPDGTTHHSRTFTLTRR